MVGVSNYSALPVLGLLDLSNTPLLGREYVTQALIFLINWRSGLPEILISLGWHLVGIGNCNYIPQQCSINPNHFCSLPVMSAAGIKCIQIQLIGILGQLSRSVDLMRRRLETPHLCARELRTVWFHVNPYGPCIVDLP